MLWASLRKNISYPLHITERRDHAKELAQKFTGQANVSLLLIMIE